MQDAPVTPSRSMLRTMLRMQDRMNTRVHPNWIAQGFAWHRAIWVECAELVDHYGYKWWKHQHHDLAQIQLEVVDIWHFGLSACFRQGESIETVAERIVGGWPSPPASRDVLESAEALAAVAAGDGAFSVSDFAALLQAVGMSFDELFRQYLAKNVLNVFRQDHGYQQGAYRKLWAGREDNEHLMELLPAIDTAGENAEAELYRALAQRYAATARG